MANAQNIDKIFAELAKKVQREVQINLPRKGRQPNVSNRGGELRGSTPL